MFPFICNLSSICWSLFLDDWPHDHKRSGRKGFIYRPFLPFHSTSIKAVRAGTWRQEMKQGPGGVEITGFFFFFSMAHSTCLLIAPRTTHLGVACHRVSWLVAYQSSIKIMSPRLPCSLASLVGKMFSVGIPKWFLLVSSWHTAFYFYFFIFIFLGCY